MVEIDSAIKTCIENRPHPRIRYTREFMLSIRHRITSKYVAPKKLGSSRHVGYNFNKTPLTNGLADGDNKDEELPEWYFDGPKNASDEYDLELCSHLPDQEQISPKQTAPAMTKTPPQPNQANSNKRETVVPVIKTLRDIELKLNVKPAVHAKSRVDTSAYYTLLGILSDKKSSHICSTEPNQTALKWIQSLRNIGSPSSSSSTNVRRHEPKPFLPHRGFPSYWPPVALPPIATPQYLTFLAMQQTANSQMRQYMANWANYQQQAMIGMSSPPSPVTSGFDKYMKVHRMAMNELLQSQLDGSQELFMNNANKYGNHKRDYARHKPLVIVTPPASPSKTNNKMSLNAEK